MLSYEIIPFVRGKEKYLSLVCCFRNSKSEKIEVAYLYGVFHQLSNLSIFDSKSKAPFDWFFVFELKHVKSLEPSGKYPHATSLVNKIIAYFKAMQRQFGVVAVIANGISDSSCLSQNNFLLTDETTKGKAIWLVVDNIESLTKIAAMVDSVCTATPILSLEEIRDLAKAKD